MSSVERRFVVGAALAASVIALVAHHVRDAEATLDDTAFSSREAGIRMALPRGWRASETPAYPGILLWLNHTQPPGELLLTVEDIGPDARHCWPADAQDGNVRCRDEATASAFLCVLRSRLAHAGFELGPIEEGRWFDFQERANPRRFMRQGVVVGGDRAFSLILGAPTTADRATHGRAFERSLRALRPVGASEASEASGPALDAAVASDDAGPGDAPRAADARAAPIQASDAGVVDAAPTAAVAPCPR
jgi:hypothetical protein